MIGLIGTAGRRLANGALRMVGLELRRYSPASPIQGSAEAELPNEGNILSVISAMSPSLPRRPAPFVLVATNHGTLIVNRNDYHAKERLPRYGVGHQLLKFSSFDYTEVTLALALLSKRKASYGPGVVALDCGANIGVHAVEWARHMHGWGNVIAIEAQERIFYALCGNLTINNCMNAKAIWAAVGSKSGEMHIPIPDYYKPASFGSLELRKREATEFIGQEIDYSEDASATVDVISIDDLELNRLDFLKIDVEGMEMDVLVGATKTIEREHPLMIIEIVKSNRTELISFLKNYGYAYYCFEGNVLAVQCADSLTSNITELEGFTKIDLGGELDPENETDG
jgi:FkbM family methyltransferase